MLSPVGYECKIACLLFYTHAMQIYLPRDANRFSSRGIFPNLLNSVFPLGGKETMLGNHADIIRQPHIYYMGLAGRGAVFLPETPVTKWKNAREDCHKMCKRR